MSDVAGTGFGERLGEVHLRRLVDVGRSLVSNLDLESVLQSVLEAARDLTGARYAALGVLNDRGDALERFLTIGIDELTRARDRRPAAGPRRARGAHQRSAAAAAGGRRCAPAVVRISRRAPADDHVPGRPGPDPRRRLRQPLSDRQGRRRSSTRPTRRRSCCSPNGPAIAIANARLYRSATERRDELQRAMAGFEAALAVARAVGGETRARPDPGADRQTRPGAGRRPLDVRRARIRRPSDRGRDRRWAGALARAPVGGRPVRRRRRPCSASTAGAPGGDRSATVTVSRASRRGRRCSCRWCSGA